MNEKQNSRRGGGFDLSSIADGRDMFTKRVALQRILRRADSAFLDFMVEGLPADVSLERVRRAISISKHAFLNVLGDDFDGEAFAEFIPTAYDITVMEPDNSRAVVIMVDVLKAANESAMAVWPDGASKKPFPFRPQHAIAPSLASLVLKIGRCAETYDLRLGRTLFIKALTTMVAETSVRLAQRMMPESTEAELTALTQSVIKKVGAVAISAWHDVSADLIRHLRLLPESDRAAAAAEYRPMTKIRNRIDEALADMPEMVIAMHDLVEQEVAKSLAHQQQPPAPLPARPEPIRQAP